VTDPAAYRRVRVRVKEASLPAWDKPRRLTSAGTAAVDGVTRRRVNELAGVTQYPLYRR